jgi:hypothetical protein
MCVYKLTIVTFFCKAVDAIIEEVPSGLAVLVEVLTMSE